MAQCWQDSDTWQPILYKGVLCEGTGLISAPGKVPLSVVRHAALPGPLQERLRLKATPIAADATNQGLAPVYKRLDAEPTLVLHRPRVGQRPLLIA